MFCHSVFACRAQRTANRVGYPQPSGAMLPIWVMAEAKLDQKYGVELQNIYISGGARLTQTVVSGDIDIAATGGAVVNAVLSGAELVYIASGVPTYGFSLYARADVKDVPSLKGKVVGLMTKGASTDHGMTALLRQYNFVPVRMSKFYISVACARGWRRWTAASSRRRRFRRRRHSWRGGWATRSW